MLKNRNLSLTLYCLLHGLGDLINYCFNPLAYLSTSFCILVSYRSTRILLLKHRNSSIASYYCMSVIPNALKNHFAI